MIVGSVGPWAKVAIFTVNGTDDGKDGWIVLVAAVVAALLLVGMLLTRRRPFAIVSVIVGLIGAGTSGYDIHDINSTASAHNLPGDLVSTQWGIWVALVGSISLAIASVALWLETRRARGPAVEPV